MLTPESKKLHEERHKQLVEAVRGKYPSDQYAHYSEAMWEHTLGDLSAGKYDAPLGLRLFVAELLARADRQEFIDKTAIRLCQIARNGTSKAEIEGYARVAYEQAEALWRERQQRRNRGDQEIPF
jgi:hypothetical protein